jgi:hypothetical protein
VEIALASMRFGMRILTNINSRPELISFWGLTGAEVDSIPGAHNWPFESFKLQPYSPKYPSTTLHLLRQVDPVIRAKYGLGPNFSLYREDELIERLEGRAPMIREILPKQAFTHANRAHPPVTRDRKRRMDDR